MGYRSDVAIAFREKDFIELEKKIESISDNKLKKLVYELLHDDCETTKDDEHRVVHWSSIKWYDFSPDVKWIMENLPPIHSFIELGEDVDDIKTEISAEAETGERDDYMYSILQISRDIYIDI